MVFIIQNTQNRDAKAIQLKLDELIRAVKGARTGLVRLEEFSDKDLQPTGQRFREAARSVGRANAWTERSEK
jgi:low affinity Fe/Cu permease